MVVAGLVERSRNLIPGKRRLGVDRYRRYAAGDEFDCDLSDTVDRL